jgi:hypothetical protein
MFSTISIPKISPSCACNAGCEATTHEPECPVYHGGPTVDICGNEICHPLLPHVRSHHRDCVDDSILCIALAQAECHRICGCNGDLSVLYAALHFLSLPDLHNANMDGAIARSLKETPGAIDRAGWQLTVWGQMYQVLVEDNRIGDSWMIF